MNIKKLYNDTVIGVIFMKIAIIGGVAAGTSAAAKARRVNPDAEIVIFEKGRNISYAGCGLPYYISGVSESRDKVIIFSPQEFTEKYKVEVKTGHEVTEIEPRDKTVYFKDSVNGLTGKYLYDKLIITTGASPVIPPIQGAEPGNVFSLRTIEDADEIVKMINKRELSRVSIVGGGLIGMEMAEAFKRLDLEVDVIEKQAHVLPTFSAGMAEIIEKHLKENNINLLTGETIVRLSGNSEGDVKSIYLESGKEIRTDLVLISVGIKPNTELARKAGIKIGPTGAISVNEKMETSLPDIYAAGDCVESTNLITGNPVWVPLGSTANKQGRVAGENAAGGNATHRGILNTSITKVFELGVARTGLSEKEAREAGFKAFSIKIRSVNHAGYYPDMEKIYLNGVFDKKTGRILGAEVIGKEGADKRIDVLATAIYNKLTANDLFQLDLAYAPPYSIPKDPVALLGLQAEKEL